MDFYSIKQQLNENKTPFVELESCSKCGCTLYYARAGRRHNGCVGCHNSANANHELLTSAQMIDCNDVPIYEGRACHVCGGRTRLLVATYGANKGKCRACAIHQQQEKAHGKQLKRLSVLVGEHAHKFVVDSIYRSGSVEVAPSNLMEWLELKDLINRARLMNVQEQSAGTGVRWEICHRYPAAGSPENPDLRGKATINNLVIAQMVENRQAGTMTPESWSVQQVISVEDVRLIQTSWEAAQAWKNSKDWADMSPEKKAEWQRKQQESTEEYKKLVREITKGFTDSLPIIEQDTFQTFGQLLEQARHQWLKTQLRMERYISAALESGRKVDYIEARGKRLTVEALHGAEARQWLIVQTLQQIADAEMILKETGITEEQSHQLSTLQRCAVMWAHDIADNPRQLVMGFTHPLLSVLGNQWFWGTRYDEATDQQWLCVWDNPTAEDLESPFDTRDKPEHINAIFADEKAEPVKDWCKDGWRSTDVDYIYEQESQKRAKKAIAEAENRHRGILKARDEAIREKQGKRISSLIKGLTDGFDELSKFIGELDSWAHDDAIKLVDDCYAWAGEREAELIAISEASHASGIEYEKAVNQWSSYSEPTQRQKRNPSITFRNLMNPF